MMSFDQGFGKRAAAVILSLVTMSLLPACEKGLMLKDPKVTAPDFNIETQAPRADAGSTVSYVIDLRAVQILTANSEATDANKQYKATVNFNIGPETPAGQEDKSRPVSLEILVDSKKAFNTSGRIPNQENEPEMTYQSRCVGDDCSKFYVSITFDFKDSHGLTQDSKVLAIAAYPSANLVKRHLFAANLELNTLSKQAQALELMDPEQVKMPQAGDVKVDEGVAAGTGTTQELEQQTSVPAADSEITDTGDTLPAVESAPQSTDDSMASAEATAENAADSAE